jgi:hypothetical protein
MTSPDHEVAATTAGSEPSKPTQPERHGPSGDDAALSRGRDVGLSNERRGSRRQGTGYFGTFFNAILMAPPRRQNEDLRHVMAAWDCLARRHPGGSGEPGLGAPHKRDGVAAISTMVRDSSCASGRAIRGHLHRVRTADAIKAHLGGERTSFPMSLTRSLCVLSGNQHSRVRGRGSQRSY